MTKVIVKEREIKDEVYNGQIREDGDGRIVIVITDVLFNPYGANKRVMRTLVLRESGNGRVAPFTTVPRGYASDKEIIRNYPKVLNGTITIKEGD